MTLTLDRPLIVFDIETTGLGDPIRIIQIATVRLAPDGQREEKVRLINPERAIEPEATAVHGITDAMVAGEKPFATYAKSMAAYFAHCDLCGFNSRRFDLVILAGEFERAGVPLDTSQVRHVDVMSLYHHFFPRDLAAAYQEYCQQRLEQAHSALGDARATLQILEAMIARHQLPAEMKELSLLADRAQKNRSAQSSGAKFLEKEGDLVIQFGKHKGRSLKWLAQNERGYLEWILKSDFDEDVKSAIRKRMGGK